jgi:hypothetical protein
MFIPADYVVVVGIVVESERKNKPDSPKCMAVCQVEFLLMVLAFWFTLSTL